MSVFSSGLYTGIKAALRKGFSEIFSAVNSWDKAFKETTQEDIQFRVWLAYNTNKLFHSYISMVSYNFPSVSA